MNKVLGFAKRRWRYILTAFIALIIGANMGPSTEEYNKVVAKANDNAEKANERGDEIERLQGENGKLNDKLVEAEPFFKLQEEERKQKEAEAKAAEEKRLAAEKAKEEAAKKEAERKAAEEQRKQEEKEKQGYNTGITYSQLARTPDKYMGEKVKFRGKVVQVIEGDGETQIRFAVNSDYDTILFASFDSAVVNSRVLEDDVITIMGTSAGLITYDSTMGGQISIPGVSIDRIDQ
ncbi:toxin regulator [Peribacillus sp. SCS-155]|uniref:toxin regulator n=1 Tax=Peribacillus sedimenti TaxID=3115297 RepID=UPI00390617B5